MSAAETLLSAALDETGWIAILGLKKGKPPIQKFFAPGDMAGAVQQAMALDSKGYDAYFSTSTFIDDSSREAKNALYVKNFKLDVDVAPDDDRKYPSQSAAVAALAQWCETHGFPIPTLVDSGFGVHVYWLLDRALDAATAKLYADKLKAVCLATGFKASPESTADVARVLRVPGTHNYKLETPRSVLLRSTVVPVPTDELLQLIDEVAAHVGADVHSKPQLTTLPASDLISGMARPAHLAGVTSDRATRQLTGFKPKSFAILIERSLEGRGCKQVLDIYTHQQSADEPRWRAGLTIAQCCDDAATAIHDMSKNHAGYSAADTEAKAAKTVGPWTCAQFEANWPEHCKGCTHSRESKSKYKVTSPIQLGEYVERSEPVEQPVMGQSMRVDLAPVQYIVPVYPPGYSRGAQGGVYADKADDRHDADLVCKYDFYMLDRLLDEDESYLMQFRLHHPKDGVLDFLIPNAHVGAPDKLREYLNSKGIMVYDKGVTMVRSYITAWNSMLENMRQVAKVKTRFGWTDEYDGFVIGDRLINKYSNFEYSRAAPSLSALLPTFDRKGDLATWKRLFNTYAHPEFTAHAFCALTGFGSILLKFLGIEGVIINAHSEKSGTGKTSTQIAAASIWGHPKGMLMTAGKNGDTANARFFKMGAFNNLPLCVDEVTKMTHEEHSQMMLAFTQGRGKDRMEASSNMLRDNNAVWAAIALTSSNNMISEKLQADATGVNGELMRVLEPEIPVTTVLTKTQADEIFNKFQENYGWAGDVFVQNLFAMGLDKVKERLAEKRREIDEALRMTPDERFWSAGGAAIIAGGIMAQEFGLHDIDMVKQQAYFGELIHLTRKRIQSTNRAASRMDFLSEFMNQRIQNTLTVMVDDDKGIVTPIHEPRGPLHIRYEQNKHMVYILTTELRKFMRDNNENLEAYLLSLKLQGSYMEHITQKRMASGTSLPNNPAKVFAFKLDDPSKIKTGE